MNDDQFFLANAYLDGELDADERRVAEADPAVMAEVEQLRAVQARVRDVEAPSAAARERAIDAAMAEFRSVTAAAAATVAPRTRATRASFWSGRGPSRYLAIAAAVVAVGALGVIVSQFGGGGDDDAGDFATEAPLDESTAATLLTSAAEETDAADAADGGAVAADDAGGEDTADMAELAEETFDVAAEAMDDADAPAAESTAESTVEDAGAEPPAYAPAPADFDPDEPVSDRASLGAFGRYLLDQEASERLGPTPNTNCAPEFNILGETTLVLDDESNDVYVGVLEADRTVLAIDRATCEPVLDGRLTEPTGG